MWQTWFLLHVLVLYVTKFTDNVSVIKDPHGTGRRLVVLRWVKSIFVFYKDKIIRDHLEVERQWEDKFYSTAFIYLALGTPFASRTSPVVQTKNWHFCLSSKYRVAFYVHHLLCRRKYLGNQERMEEKNPLLTTDQCWRGPPNPHWLSSKSIPRVNFIAWFSWSYLVCLEVPKQWIPINEQSSVLKPLSCHLILHYCLPWMFQL